MAENFNVLNIDNFVREYMKEKIKGSYPDMDVSNNSVFDDVFIKPMISILTPMFEQVANVEMKSNLKYASVLTETEIEDVGKNNYAVSRNKGGSASVVQTFGFSKLEDKGIIIPEGVVVTDSAGVKFTTTQSTKYTKAEAKRCLNTSTQTYDVTAPVKAMGKGSSYNVGANTLTICQTRFSEYLSYTTNKLAATGGQDDEPIEDYLYRVVRYYVSQHLGTAPGYESLLKGAYPNLEDIRVIGKDDEGMERDVIEVVARDAEGKIVFTQVEDEDNQSYHYYPQTKEQHVGGCVDIYVRGSEYAIQTKNVSVNSNIIELEGGVDKDSVSIKESSSGSALGYEIVYLSDTDAEAKADPKYDVVFTYHKTSLTDNFDESREESTIEDNFVVASDVHPVKIQVTKDSAVVCCGIGRDTDDLSESAITIDYTPSFAVTAYSLSFLAKVTEDSSLSGISVYALSDKGDSILITPEFRSVLVGTDDNGDNWYRFSSNYNRQECSGIRIEFDDTNTCETGILESVILYENHTGSDSVSQSIAMELDDSVLTNGEPTYAVTRDLTIPQSAKNFSVSWSTNRDDILTNLVLGTIDWDAVQHNEEIQIYANMSYTNSTENLLLDAIYTLRIKSKLTPTWSQVTEPKNAAKTLVYIKREFHVPTDVELSYIVPAASEDDVAQPVTKNYTVGYETTELSAPLSGNIISAYYTQTSQWTQKDFADWLEQIYVAFGIELARVGNPAADIYQDFSDTLSITKYNIGLSQELIADSAEIEHKFDASYLGSSQERAFLNPYPAEGEIGYLYALPNSSCTSGGLSVQIPYNKTLSGAHDLLYGQDARIVTADVLVKEAARKPVNIGIMVRTKSDAEITSLHRSQIYAAIETLFSDAGINGRVEQSDIVGQMYTNQNTASFIEYARLPLAAFYIPSDTEAEVENGNVAGDYIKASAYECLYLNKVSVIAIYDEEASTVITVNVPSMTFVQGNVIVGTRFRGYGFDGDGTPVSGAYVVKSVQDFDDTEVAVAGVLYDVNLRFTPDNPHYAAIDCQGQGLGVEE